MLRKASVMGAALALALLLPAAAQAESFCVPGPGDMPEETLQGGLTTAKRDAPGGFQGEQCGMRQISGEGNASPSWLPAESGST